VKIQPQWVVTPGKQTTNKHVLNNIGEREQPWRTPLLISDSPESLELNFIGILFSVSMSTIALVMYLEYF
jgi:hypothetical protein